MVNNNNITWDWRNDTSPQHAKWSIWPLLGNYIHIDSIPSVWFFPSDRTWFTWCALRSELPYNIGTIVLYLAGSDPVRREVNAGGGGGAAARGGPGRGRQARLQRVRADDALGSRGLEAATQREYQSIYQCNVHIKKTCQHGSKVPRENAVSAADKHC